MSVGSICIRDVDLAKLTESAQIAAQRMHSRKVGTLVVVDDEQKPIGIFTDRDLAVRVVGKGRDPFETTVEEVMTADPRSVRVDEPIESALSIMRGGPFRRVLVVDREGTLVGMLSLDDVLSQVMDEFREIGRLLDEESPHSLANP